MEHGGKRENSGRKKTGRIRTKIKSFRLSESEVNNLNILLKKIKVKNNYQNDVEALVHLIDDSLEKESKNEKWYESNNIF